MSLRVLAPVLLALWTVAAGPPPPGGGVRGGLLYPEPGAARPLGLVDGFGKLQVLEERPDGWKRIALEAWIAPEARSRLAREALEQVRAALELDEGPGLPLDLRPLRVEQTGALLRGTATRIRWTVTARNRGRLPLPDPRLEFRLLDRKGATLVRAEARCRSPLPLPPGEDGVWEVTTWLSAEQVKRYHRRRYRLRFFTPRGP